MLHELLTVSYENSKTATEISLQVLFRDPVYIYPHKYNVMEQQFKIRYTN
jgi:hypothetical protein